MASWLCIASEIFFGVCKKCLLFLLCWQIRIEICSKKHPVESRAKAACQLVNACRMFSKGGFACQMCILVYFFHMRRMKLVEQSFRTSLFFLARHFFFTNIEVPGATCRAFHHIMERKLRKFFLPWFLVCYYVLKPIVLLILSWRDKFHCSCADVLPVQNWDGLPAEVNKHLFLPLLKHCFHCLLGFKLQCDRHAPWSSFVSEISCEHIVSPQSTGPFGRWFGPCCLCQLCAVVAA